MPYPQLHPALAQALDTRGFDQLTPVQSAVIAEEAHGRDLIVSARTGSGKTVAFGLAIAPQLMEGGTLPLARAPLALVITPTRELAIQVSTELQWLYANARARVVTCVGGMDPMKERRALGGGAHIVVGTPGRLRDHVERCALECWMKPTRCSTWAFARSSRRSSMRRLRRAARCSSPRPCRGKSLPWRSATRETRFASRPLATPRDIRISPTRSRPYHRPISSMQRSICFAFTRRKRPSCSAPRVTRSGGCMPASPNADFRRFRYPERTVRTSAIRLSRRCATSALAYASRLM